MKSECGVLAIVWPMLSTTRCPFCQTLAEIHLIPNRSCVLGYTQKCLRPGRHEPRLDPTDIPKHADHAVRILEERSGQRGTESRLRAFELAIIIVVLPAQGCLQLRDDRIRDCQRVGTCDAIYCFGGVDGMVADADRGICSAPLLVGSDTTCGPKHMHAY